MSNHATVTVNGKVYIVFTPSFCESNGETYVNYYSTRNGESFGGQRATNSMAKPNTIGGKIFAEAIKAFAS
jgi:hypothetical protein